jgi:hypothetical protein
MPKKGRRLKPMSTNSDNLLDSLNFFQRLGGLELKGAPSRVGSPFSMTQSIDGQFERRANTTKLVDVILEA